MMASPIQHMKRSHRDIRWEELRLALAPQLLYDRGVPNITGIVCHPLRAGELR